MAETTIEWTKGPNGEKGFTFNPWIGCTKVSPACDHCYAENLMDARMRVVQWGAGQPRKRTSARNWNDPLRWNAEAERLGVRYRVFCASLADVFDNEVPGSWRIDLLDLINRTPRLDWLLLTKRIGNAHGMLNTATRNLTGAAPTWWSAEAWPNVWLGATICNQAEADRDIPKLLATPARVRFLSIEPLLGPLDLRFHIFSEPTGNFRTHAGKRQMELRKPADGGLHWVIVGGESGPQARPMHPQWARNLRDQCADAGVPFLFKQWGEWVPRSACYHTFEDGSDCASLDPGAARWPCVRLTERGHNGRNLAHAGEGDHAYMQRVGKKMAGRLLDGRTWDEVPV